MPACGRSRHQAPWTLEDVEDVRLQRDDALRRDAREREHLRVRHVHDELVVVRPADAGCKDDLAERGLGQAVLGHQEHADPSSLDVAGAVEARPPGVGMSSISRRNRRLF